MNNPNEIFWNKYYSTANNDDIQKPSDFANFIYTNYLLNDESKIIADLGCGNCRDTILLSQNGNTCYAVDCNLVVNDKVPNIHYIKENAADFMKSKQKTNFDIIYMRWFLHAMPYNDSFDIVKLSSQCLKKSGLICIEVRSLDDLDLVEKSTYDDTDESYTTTHKRWPFNKKMLLDISIKNNLEIVYIEEDYFSNNTNTETTNPLLIRVIYRNSN